MTIEVKTRKVFYSSLANRCYLTRAAAISAEARALIKNKHPTEASEASIGHYYPGWHWSLMKRSDVLFRRVCRLIKNNTGVINL